MIITPHILFKRLFGILQDHELCFLSGSFVFDTDSMFNILKSYGTNARNAGNVKMNKRLGQGKLMRQHARTHNFHMYDTIFQKQRLGYITKGNTPNVKIVRIVKSSPQYELAFDRPFIKCPCGSACDAPKRVILFYRFETSENRAYTFVKLESWSTITWNQMLPHAKNAFWHYYGSEIKANRGFPERRENIVRVAPASSDFVACSHDTSCNTKLLNYKPIKVKSIRNNGTVRMKGTNCCIKIKRSMLYPNELHDKAFYVFRSLSETQALLDYNKTLRTRNEFFVTAELLNDVVTNK